MRSSTLALLGSAFVVALAGCYLPSDDAGQTGPALEAESAMFPRLSHAQWENTVRDLLRLPAPPGLASGFTTDPPGSTFDNNVAKMQVTPGLFGDYQRAADDVAAKVVADPKALARIVPPNLPTDAALKARAFVETFGKRAFRRPLTDAEITTYTALFAKGLDLTQTKDPFAAGVEVTIVAMLQSPHFIYHEEIGEPASDGRVHLSGFEVASKLSYALWNTMPDDELLGAAADGSLTTHEGVVARAAKMLDDPRAAAMLVAFHETLFNLGQYANVSKDTTVLPDWNANVPGAMKTESETFVRDVVVTRSAGLNELLTAPYTFVNQDLAKLYGVKGNFGADFVRVDLDPAQRAGILTQVGFLSKNSGLREVDSIHRGVFINLSLLCAGLPPPPGVIPPLPASNGRTNRETVTAHTGAGTCGAGCHGTLINPIGFAFENYDAIGKYRTTDNGHPVDASDTYPFLDGPQSYKNAIDLMKVMVARPQTHACYAKHWLEYTYGRDPSAEDAALVDAAAKTSLEGGSVKKLILSLVTSERFTSRPGAQK